MAKRSANEDLKTLFDAGKKIYSISKVNTIDQCLFEAYNAYVLHEKGQNSIYGVLGTKVHDKLEAITNGKASPAELPSTLAEELADMDMLDISFPKDFKGGDSIRNNWIADMTHFCKTFVPLKGKFDTEELFIYKLSDDRYVQGYIDLIRHNEDGTISIMDWKTSSEFSKEDLLHHGRQLVLYAIAKEEQGYTVRDVSWYMLKYCEVSYMGKKRSNAKNLSLITKTVNRGKLVNELKISIEYFLSQEGYDDVDIELMISKAMEENSLDSLPEVIRANYRIEPHIVTYSITDELKRECIDYINRTADLYESLDGTSAASFPPRAFTKRNSKGAEVEDIFFCSVLCNYRNSCKHLKVHKELWEAKKTDADWEKDLF